VVGRPSAVAAERIALTARSAMSHGLQQLCTCVIVVALCTPSGLYLPTRLSATRIDPRDASVLARGGMCYDAVSVRLSVAQLDQTYHTYAYAVFEHMFRYACVIQSELSMGSVDPWVGLGWVHYSKSAKNFKGLF